MPSSTAFVSIMRVLRALSVYDKRIVEELGTLQYGRVPRRGKIIKFIGKVPVGMKMSLAKFERAIKLKMWENVARLNWRPFEEARDFARKLKLKNVKEWFSFCKSGNKPADIPQSPWLIYAEWVHFADWLGTRRFQYNDDNLTPFKQARAFARKLGLKSGNEWKAYAASNKRPIGIPACPWDQYADRGWISMPDWLGIKDRGNWRPFEEARLFARKLRLKTGPEWQEYCKSGKLPANIPSTPEQVYAKTGWAGISDWLGSGGRRVGGWRSFEDARAFVRSLGLKSEDEWRTYLGSGKRPSDVPAVPSRVYADEWIGMSDWLGNGRRPLRAKWRSFKNARAFVRRLGLKGTEQWFAYCRSGKKPNDIPALPKYAYRTDWVNWPDWLGFDGRKNVRQRYGWRPFKQARAFVRRLGLKTVKEWYAYCASGKKPNDIPASPEVIYADAGWKGIPDWLGTE